MNAMNTLLFGRLSVAAGVNPKLFNMRPFHFRNVFSTLAHSQSLFSHFASTKLNMSEADITRMFKSYPPLQRLQTLENVEQFIQLLKRYGCAEGQITTIMQRRPAIISVSAERILEPKIKLLDDFGFEGKHLTKFLTSSPHILTCSLNDLLPKMEFLRNVFQSQAVLVKVLLRAPWLITNNLEKTLKPSFAFWKGWGFCGTDLCRFLQIHPFILLRTSLTPPQADLIHKIGVDKGRKSFKIILSLVAVSRVETLEAKIQNLKSCGLSAEEIWHVFRVDPTIFNCSKENISAKMNFIVDRMELPANCVVKHTSLLKWSLEKKIMPRFLVCQKIKSINDPGLSLLKVMRMSEARFVNEVIKDHPESKTLLTIYENAVSNASNSKKS